MIDIRAITTDEEHAAALSEIDRLWPSDDSSDVAAIEAMTLLVEAYEAKRWPMEVTLDPIDLIRHAMTSDVGHSRQDFVAVIGSASGASQVLARKRPLTLEMIRKLSDRWGIPIELLTPAYRMNPSAAKKGTARGSAGRARTAV